MQKTAIYLTLKPTLVQTGVHSALVVCLFTKAMFVALGLVVYCELWVHSFPWCEVAMDGYGALWYRTFKMQH